MRLPNWENRLSEVVIEWKARTFDWDTSNDCGHWTDDFVSAVTGERPLQKLGLVYGSEYQALKLLAQKSMPEWLDELFPRVHPAFAQRGDIALVQESCLGCVLGTGALFFFEDGGMIMVPRREWEGVWGVGRNG